MRGRKVSPELAEDAQQRSPSSVQGLSSELAPGPLLTGLGEVDATATHGLPGGRCSSEDSPSFSTAGLPLPASSSVSVTKRDRQRCTHLR